MSETKSFELGEFVPKTQNVNPAHFPDETFELLSIPAYDSGAPILTIGSKIGSSKQVVQPGDVMISKIVPHIRRVWVVPSPQGEHRQIASGEWIVFRTDQILGSWLRHFLLSDAFHAQFLNTVAGVGGSLVRARPQFVKKIRVEVPSVEIQKKESDAKDLQEIIEQKRARQRELLGELEKSIFHQMFGSMYRNPRWPTKSIDEISESTLGKMLDKRKQNGENSKYPYLRNANVQWFSIDFSNLEFMEFSIKDQSKYSLQKGDILMCEGGDPGRCAIVEEDLEFIYFQKALHRIRLNPDVLPEYFIRAIQSLIKEGGISQSISNATISHLTGEKLKKINIPIPPLSKQKLFSEFIHTIQRVRTQ